MKLVAIFMVLAMTVGHVEAQEGALRHVVAFKFKSDASEEQVHSLIKAFGDLKNSIPEILKSDNASSETGTKWTQICRNFHIKQETSEPHQPQQNLAEPEIG